MSQINSNTKDDFQVVFLLSCFVGHPVYNNMQVHINIQVHINMQVHNNMQEHNNMYVHNNMQIHYIKAHIISGT